MSGDMKDIDSLKQEILECKNCELRNFAKKPVFSRGSYKHKIMFVGEGPGENEDIKSIPFCGKAGKKLEEMSEKSGLSVSECYLSNIVRCKPFKTGSPKPPPQKCIEKCIPFLHREIEILKPFMIITLGKKASEALIESCDSKTSMKEIVFTTFYYNSKDKKIPIVPLYHPSWVLRKKSMNKEEKWIRNYTDLIDLYYSIETMSKI